MWIESGAEGSWFVWLTTHTSFSFQGQHGHLNVFKETRARGAGYWYAYHTQSGQTRKRYLGRSATVTLARLEEAAHALDGQTTPDVSSPRAPSTSDRSPTPSHYPGQGQQPSLLLPKFRPPRLPSSSIWRQRLIARLEEGRQGKLTLVLAPAGSGKTTLIRQWMETQDPETQLAWLSLDPEDDDPIRFWRYVLPACERTEGKPGHNALKLL